MPPSASKSNYKSYESQARLVRAMVAAHPEVKWNYKAPAAEIIRCFGTDMTEHALNHRFRVIRTHCEIIQRGLQQGFDMQDLPAEPPGNPRTIESIDNQIAKYFGSSTTDGINFQFRSIRSDAKRMKEAAESGGDPKLVPLTTGTAQSLDSVSSAANTPRKPGARTPRTPGSRGTGSRGGRKSAAKNSATPMVDVKEEDDDESDMVDTPTKPRDKVIAGRVAKKTPRPPREAASRANAMITQQASPPKDDFAATDADADADSSEEAFVIKTEPNLAEYVQPAAAGRTDRHPSVSPQAPDPAPVRAPAAALASNAPSSKSSASAHITYKPARTSLFGGPQPSASAGSVFGDVGEVDSSFGLPDFGFTSFNRNPMNDSLSEMAAPPSFDVDFSLTDGEF